MADAPAGRSRTARRIPFRLALVVALAVAVTGGVLAVRGYAAGRSDPESVVRAYFAALERGDAAAALGYGDLPDGPRSLLTDRALQAQQRVAPIRDLTVVSTRRVGDTATVAVGYTLGFDDGPVTVAADVGVRRVEGVWGLDATAVATRFDFDVAAQRAAISGVQVPAGRTLVFPGAIALTFDSRYLAGSAGNGSITFGARATTPVVVTVTAAGRRAMRSATLAALGRCLRAGSAVTCPQPDERYVPGSLRGHVIGALHDPKITLLPTQVGLLKLDATASVAIRYRRLDFRNEVRDGQGTRTVELHAIAAAVDPLSVRWGL